MKEQWKKVLVKTVAWSIAEIILNFVGLDNIADYSEFVFEHTDVSRVTIVQFAKIDSLVSFVTPCIK
jgi:hypothetical protein